MLTILYGNYTHNRLQYLNRILWKYYLPKYTMSICLHRAFFKFTFKDSLINGLILLEFILTKYISTWVLINEVIGKRPNSDLAEILHDVF